MLINILDDVEWRGAKILERKEKTANIFYMMSLHNYFTNLVEIEILFGMRNCNFHYNLRVENSRNNCKYHEDFVEGREKASYYGGLTEIEKL